MKTSTIKISLLTLLLVVLTNNVFCQNNSDGDDRMKIRLGFTSVNDIHRQLLVTVDSNATKGIDFGYDAENYENHVDDMYWMIEDRKFLIQGTDVIDATTTLPIGLHTNRNGNSIISIEDLTNFPEDLEIGILDKDTNTYYDFRQASSYSIHLAAGEYLNRFELIFVNDTSEDTNDTSNDDEESNDVSNDDEETETEVIVEADLDNEVDTEDEDMELSYLNRIKSISIKNIGRQTIKSVDVYSITGQLISKYTDINAVDQALIKAYNLNAGNYILIVSTDIGRVTKKVSVR